MYQRRRAGTTPRWSCARTCAPGDVIAGPAIIAEKQRHHRRRAGLAGARHRARPPRARPRRGRATRAVRHRHQRRSGDARGLQQPVHDIAEQMGLRLQNTAYSVNIKERLDFSCALFDADGNLIANAPHMPVHLGSMGESDQDRDRARTPADAAGRRLRAERPVPRRHAPARRHRDHAGVRRGAATSILFYVGSRGHHADIGGITPGSMPPFSTRIEEEGVLIDNFLLVEGGRLRESEMRRAARQRRATRRATPSRTSPTCRRRSRPTRRACRSCARWSTQFGLDVVQAYMRHVQDNAEESVRRVITRAEGRRVRRCRWTTARRSRWRSASTPTARSAEIDFTGTSRAAAEQLQRADARCAWRRCCTCSARWSTTTSRSTPAA